MIELVKYHNCIGFVCFRVVKCIIRNGYLMIENYVLYCDSKREVDSENS